jgi:hypothetical protein
MNPSDIKNRSRGMTETLQAELAGITTLVKAATIPSDASHTVVWCLEQLPKLYAKFYQTRESRYGDEILRLEQGILGELAKSPLPAPNVRGLGQVVLERLRHLHEHFGLPGLDFKVLPAARPRSRRTD